MICGAWFTDDDLTCDASTPAASGAPDAAIAWVYRRTGHRWPGLCTTTVRPLLPCGHQGDCGCRHWHRIDLTRWLTGPIRSIEAIEVDGVTVDATTAALLNGKWLTALRDTPLYPWPHQDMTLAPGTVGTWSVTVTHGALPPPDVLMATKALACQLVAKAEGRKCDLPDNTTSVSDNGITITLALPENGRTGIPWVDSILDQYPAQGVARLHDPAAEVAPRWP